MALRLVSDAAPPPIPKEALRTSGEPWWTHLAPPTAPAIEQDPIRQHPLLSEKDLEPGGTMVRRTLFGPANDTGKR